VRSRICWSPHTTELGGALPRRVQRLHERSELGRREPAHADLVQPAHRPYAIGYFTGDYEGLDNFGTTFTPFFVQANGPDPIQPLSDAFYSTAGP
jgi:hypothetical protein